MRKSHYPNQDTTDVWTSENNPGQQTALAVGCTLVGLVLIVGFRDFGAWNSDNAAGFGLGLLLFVLGLAGLLASGRQTVQMDGIRRQVVITDTNRFGTKTTIIHFAEIVDVRIGYLGKKSNYVDYYYLSVKLKTGETYPLFAPGRFYKGTSDKSTVMEWKRRLEAYLAQ